MTDNQNEFYSSISKYYSEIFPFQPMQLQFIKNRAGLLNEKRLLDIGCATGELALRLASAGALVTGIDLNEELLSQALAKKQDSHYKTANPLFLKGNMLELKTDFRSGQFNVVLCFGNTLVHLQNTELVQQTLTGVYAILKTGGHFLLQILNYDYILHEHVTTLPVIETEIIRFIRKYRFTENSPMINFQTELLIKSENKAIFNETPLFPIQSKQLYHLLQNAGFSEIDFFSSFKEEAFGGKHLPLVVSCRK